MILFGVVLVALYLLLDTDRYRARPPRLAQANVRIVVNHAVPLDRDGLLQHHSIDWRHDETGQVNQREMFVIDGRIGWVGGAGIDDHFASGGYHDVFDASPATDKQLVTLEAAGHYLTPVPGSTKPDPRERLIDLLVPWLRERLP